jgi:hypothetical protein
MRNYKVVENDVDVHELWRAARAEGFRQLRLAIFHGPPFHVNLTEFEDFLAGGPATAPWVTSTRVFLRNARTFFLIKEGSERVDSRRADGLRCHIHVSPIDESISAGSAITTDAIVTNTGTAIWRPWDSGPGGVGCGVHLYDRDGTLLSFDAGVVAVADSGREVVPGQSERVRITIPPQPPGTYIIELDCVASQVSWFAPLGSRPARVTVTVSS